jgi:hypothetical protein
VQNILNKRLNLVFWNPPIVRQGPGKVAALLDTHTLNSTVAVN